MPDNERMVFLVPGVSRCELGCGGLATAQIGTPIGDWIMFVCDDCMMEFL